jgi:preprotein translocase subunit SecA
VFRKLEGVVGIDEKCHLRAARQRFELARIVVVEALDVSQRAGTDPARDFKAVALHLRLQRPHRILPALDGRLKRLKNQAEYITSLEPEFEKLSDEQLAAKTPEFRQRIENGEAPEDLLFEAYAAVREAFKRTMDIRLFDVQLMGGIVLHEGDIAEMKTGEGKTFVAVQPLYLNALTGNNVHLVTVNDYLAKRDPEWTKPVWDALGMRVGYIQNMMPFAERRAAYEADVTYGTNSEFGFDYLRDNMAVSLEGVVQRAHAYAIVDEVDSILIDEARTPLIISGAVQDSTKWYQTFARIAPRLQRDVHYEVDEKKRTIGITEEGVEKVEDWLGIDNLYESVNTPLISFELAAVSVGPDWRPTDCSINNASLPLRSSTAAARSRRCPTRSRAATRRRAAGACSSARRTCVRAATR